MAGSILTYDPKSVTILVSGWQLIGVVEVTLEWKSKPFTVRKGIRGVNTRVHNKDTGGTIGLRVLPTSITNDVLSDIVRQDVVTRSARIEIQIKDGSGTTLIHSTNAFVSGYPNVSFNAEGIEVREWEIEVLSFVDSFVGGNAGSGIDINDILSGPLEGVTSIADGITSRLSGLTGQVSNSINDFF